MFRKFFSATALVSVVAAGLSFSARTQACPVPMPQTLLWLYKNSSEIHLARYAKSEDIGIESDEVEYSYVSVRHYFDVSSTLKGTTRKLVTFDETEYRSKRSEEVEEMSESEEDESEDLEETTEIEVKGDLSHMEEEEDEEEEYGGWRQPGETVLVFLKEKVDEEEDEGTGKQRAGRKDKEPELVLTSVRDGVRHISPDDSGTFESRIKELNSIYSGDPRTQDKELVEWMIRCMEHHATRWDGAYELNGSFESLDRIEDAAEYTGDDDGKPFVWQSDEEEARFARLVTQTQMDRISSLLMSPGETPRNAIPTFMRDGESALIDLVERWAGADVAKFLLQRLRNGSLGPWETARLMGSIATMLEDDELSKAAESYGDIGYGEDNDIYEEDEDEDEQLESDAELADGETQTEILTSDDAEVEDAADVKAVAKKPARTYLEVKAERLAAFIALADGFLAKPEVELDLTLKAAATGKDK